jgi:hypothetical protein
MLDGLPAPATNRSATAGSGARQPAGDGGTPAPASGEKRAADMITRADPADIPSTTFLEPDTETLVGAHPGKSSVRRQRRQEQIQAELTTDAAAARAAVDAFVARSGRGSPRSPS